MQFGAAGDGGKNYYDAAKSAGREEKRQNRRRDGVSWVLQRVSSAGRCWKAIREHMSSKGMESVHEMQAGLKAAGAPEREAVFPDCPFRRDCPYPCRGRHASGGLDTYAVAWSLIGQMTPDGAGLPAVDLPTVSQGQEHELKDRLMPNNPQNTAMS